MKRKKILLMTLLTMVFLTICTAASAYLMAGELDTVTNMGGITQNTTQTDPATDPIASIPSVTAPPILTPSPSPSPTPEPVFEEYDITMMALGDNLMHMGIVYTGKMNDGTFDYSFLFRTISDFLDAADIKAINQETILAGNELGFSGFPNFNSPTEIADAIAEAGFNVVLHATNHAADQGLDVIKNCAAYWEQFPEVLMTGISGDDSPSDISYLTIKDITFAILNYTYGPNLATLPSALKGHLNMLCDYDSNTGAINFTALNPEVTEDIREARENADIVIVFPHWGTEYQTVPSVYQKTFAEEMAEAGADLIIGTHPHVPQPIEWVTSENGNRALCYYSLGNYVSTQKETKCMLEGMAWITFHVTEDGISITDEKSGVVPMVCHYKSGPVRLEGVYPLEDYTEEMALRHGIWSYGGVPLHLSDLQEQSSTTFGEMILTREEIFGQAASTGTDALPKEN